MTDLVYNILSNDAAVTSVVPASRIFSDYRSQTTATPAIVMEWMDTDDDYALGGGRCYSIYTVDVLTFAKGYGTTDTLTKAIIAALDNYSGSVTCTTGNTYDVVATQMVNRNVEAGTDDNIVEGSITFEITINSNPA